MFRATCRATKPMASAAPPRRARAAARAVTKTALVLLGCGEAILGAGSPPRAAAAPITIGPGPVRGVDRAGVTWYEDFQDWTSADVRALDDAWPDDSVFRFGDGLDDSRDIVAFYSRQENGNIYFRVDLFDLTLGAENGGLDVYVAVDAAPGGQVWFPDFLDCQTDRPWERCLCVYRTGLTPGTDYRLYDANFQPVLGGYLGASFHSQIDAVEFGITRQTLLDAGWDGTGPLAFQVFTAKDGADTNCSGGGRSSDLADAIVDPDRGCSDGTLNGAVFSNSTAGGVYYTAIAHGNQSVNKADDIGAHIYDPAANTGIPGGTGFQRTLDTHAIFRVPLNIHPSGTLTVACNWARRPGGASDPQDGPAFLARVREFVDGNQNETPGALVGGVFAEHILPYFEGPANAASFAFTDELNQAVYGVSAADARVLHVPERVIRSQSTGLAPLDGHTFEDLAATPYAATYLDEVTHLHGWFYASESCTPDLGYRHKLHRINGVYSFMINEREDGAKFGNHDGGMALDTRRSLLTKALYGSSSEVVVVFDDWEAFAGKSFNPVSGAAVPNNNPNQWHNTVRWAANHPWIRFSTLRDVLAAALANPAAFVIDHGTRFDLGIQGYEWLKHASEDSYHNWYYNQNGGFAGNEQSFYDLVPVITGPQGDYHTRGVGPAQDGPPLPSGLRFGDLNSPGTLLYELWQTLDTAPTGRLRDLGILSYLTMIYETAWHEEDEVNYADSNCYGAWIAPDGSWDGLNTWAVRLHNHVRQAGFYAAAAAWAAGVRNGTQSAATQSRALDLDWDGENEYVLQNNRLFAVFEKYGGRCVLAAAYDPAGQDGDVVVGAPFTNPSAPGEEEFAGPSASRCSAFKEMNGGLYADDPYAATAVAGGWRFTSSDGRVTKTITAATGSDALDAAYQESVAGPLFVRLGLSPNPRDLALHGQSSLTRQFRTADNTYTLANLQGAGATITLGSTTFNPTPTFAGFDRRNLALTEEVELSADGDFAFAVRLFAGRPAVSALPEDDDVVPTLATVGPYPSPASGGAHMSLALAKRAVVRWEILDVAGRRLVLSELGERMPGPVEFEVAARDARGAPLRTGVYFVRVTAGSAASTRRWTVIRP